MYDSRNIHLRHEIDYLQLLWDHRFFFFLPLVLFFFLFFFMIGQHKKLMVHNFSPRGAPPRKGYEVNAQKTGGKQQMRTPPLYITVKYVS